MSDQSKKNTSLHATDTNVSGASHTKSFDEISRLKKAKEKLLSNESVVKK